MSSVAEGVPKHISREPGVNLNRKTFFFKNAYNARFNICLLPAQVTADSSWALKAQPLVCGSRDGRAGIERHLLAAEARRALHVSGREAGAKPIMRRLA